MKTSFLLAGTILLGVTYSADLLFVDDLDAADSYELYEAPLLGFSSDVVTISEWKGMKTKDFASYKAIIINDPGFSSAADYPTSIDFLAETSTVWGPAVGGNVIVIGADPSHHSSSEQGAVDLISNSMRFVTDDKLTGLYFALSRYWDSANTATVDALSYFGHFAVRGNFTVDGFTQCYDDVHVVASSPAIKNLTDADLSNWGCSVHEAFVSYPTQGRNGFQSLAIANGVTGVGTQNFAEGHHGLPYIISRGATPAGCGDGHWDKTIGEECDDGNIKDGDGCSKSCKCESGYPKGDGTCWPVPTDAAGLLMMPKPSAQPGPVLYFTSTYMCIIITVLFKTLWGIVVASSRMIEPFHQLHKPSGASAQESLLSDYLSSGLSMESLKNIFRRHWVMVSTTGVYVATTVSMLVASDVMTIRSGNNCLTPDDPLQCDLRWVIDPKVARALQALMILCALMIIARIVLGWRRESGVSSYPCTLASMATLLNNPAIMNSFMHIDPDSKAKDIAKALSENHYAIRHYESSPGEFRYGLTQVAAPKQPHWIATLWAQISTIMSRPRANPKTEKKHPWYREHLFLGLTLLVHLVLLGIFLYYRLSPSSSLFLNKTRFGPRFFLTFACFVLSLAWGRLEAEVRIMTPYRKLSNPKSDSRQILEMPLHGVPLTALFRALWYGHWYHALIAVVALLSQCLIIAVSGIPYNFGVIQDISLFSSTTCIGILGIMIFTLISMAWWRKSNPNLVRTPDTLANVIMMLCASQMVQHFNDLSHDTIRKKDLENAVKGRQFRLSKKVGPDGKERMLVDVVEVAPEPTSFEEKVEQGPKEKDQGIVVATTTIAD